MKRYNSQTVSENTLPSNKINLSSLTKDAVATFDAEFVIRTANSTFLKILGFQEYNPVGSSLFSLPFFQEKKYADLCDYLKNKEVEQFKSETNFVSAEHVRVNLEATVIAHNTYFFSGGTLLVRDISQLKVLQEMLSASQSDLAQKNQQVQQIEGLSNQLNSFLYVASHDLKEPLRTIGNFSQLLNRQCHGYIDDTGREYLSFIMDGVKSMNALIDDLLHYSSLDSRKHITQEAYLPTMMFMLEKMQAKNIKAANAQLTFGDMPDTIIGDKAKIRQLFEALLSNALKFRQLDRPLEVNISGREIEGGYEFSIKDNGIGVKEEFFGKIFEMFKRLHNRKKYEGTGIGLALCKKIVEQHGGEINIQSEFDKGSIFIFSIMRHNV